MKKQTIAVVAALTMLLPFAPGFAQTSSGTDSVPALLAKTNEAYAAGDKTALKASLERLHELRPFNSEYMYRLVLAYAMLEEKTPAYNLMLRMQQQGLAYDFEATDESQNIRGTEVFDYVNSLMRNAAQPVGDAEPVFTLPAGGAMPGSLDWDATRQAFLVGTINDGRVLAVDENGQVSELLKADRENGLWSVVDVLADAARNRLWVTSAALPAFKGAGPADQGRSTLFEFDLETLELLRKYPVPADGRPHALGSMAMNSNGDIYIADRILPIVYTKPAAEEKLQVVFVTRDMVSLRDIAIQPDGRIMYIADRELGILVVDLAGQRAAKLAIPDTLNVGGIDGLFLWNNHLAIVQNGISPQRVMRLTLDASGTKVESVRPLAVALPDFDEPSFGVVKGDDLYFFANGRWAGDGQSAAVKVVRTGLDSNADLISPEMQLFLEQQEKLQQERAQQDAEKD